MLRGSHKRKDAKKRKDTCSTITDLLATERPGAAEWRHGVRVGWSDGKTWHRWFGGSDLQSMDERLRFHFGQLLAPFADFLDRRYDRPAALSLENRARIRPVNDRIEIESQHSSISNTQVVLRRQPPP